MLKIMKELWQLFSIRHWHSSVYHPQVDGLVERFNKTLKNILKMLVDKVRRDWDCLVTYLFAIREVPQFSTVILSVELLYGRLP